MIKPHILSLRIHKFVKLKLKLWKRAASPSWKGGKASHLVGEKVLSLHGDCIVICDPDSLPSMKTSVASAHCSTAKDEGVVISSGL